MPSPSHWTANGCAAPAFLAWPANITASRSCGTPRPAVSCPACGTSCCCSPPPVALTDGRILLLSYVGESRVWTPGPAAHPRCRSRSPGPINSAVAFLPDGRCHPHQRRLPLGREDGPPSATVTAHPRPMSGLFSALAVSRDGQRSPWPRVPRSAGAGLTGCRCAMCRPASSCPAAGSGGSWWQSRSARTAAGWPWPAIPRRSTSSTPRRGRCCTRARAHRRFQLAPSARRGGSLRPRRPSAGERRPRPAGASLGRGGREGGRVFDRHSVPILAVAFGAPMAAGSRPEEGRRRWDPRPSRLN